MTTSTHSSFLFLSCILITCFLSLAIAEPSQEDYYQIESIAIPENIVLEAGGIEQMPDGQVAVSTRRGDIFMVANLLDEVKGNETFSLWARGLHEVLGLAYADGWLYATQRPEVTRIKDSDGDGRADVFETVSDDWGVSGDYHEYAFGSRFDPQGNMWVVLCLTGSFKSNVPYRGWCVRVSKDGTMIPTASGIRSPGGIGLNAKGEAFYCDTQGPWNGTSSLKHLTAGSFQGHPGGFDWFKLDEVQDALGQKHGEPIDGSRFHEEMDRLPHYRPPAILLPHGVVGNSASGIAPDISQGKFGPFEEQLFVSDQTHSVVNRCYLEKIDGYYQGACFPFLKGFGSGNVPLIQASDGSLLSGGTDRGWGARGGKRFALDRVTWNGKTPFEILEMRAKPDGFELEFTKKVNQKSVERLDSYEIETYTYIFQGKYGSPKVDETIPEILSAKMGKSGKTVRLKIKGLQRGHVHELRCNGVLSKNEELALLNDSAFYTLWNIPSP